MFFLTHNLSISHLHKKQASETILHTLITNILASIPRNARMLVSSLEPILDDREKLNMVPYLSQLLPENEQNAFDKEAQKLFSKYLQG